LNYISTEEFVRSIPLCKANVDCNLPENRETEQFETLENIYSQKGHDLWLTRAKVMYLLRFVTNEKIDKTNKVVDKKINWEEIIPALIDAMVSEKEQLIVSKAALDSFRHLVTDFQNISPASTAENSGTVFDFEKAKRYWESNRPEIIKELKSKEH